MTLDVAYEGRLVEAGHQEVRRLRRNDTQADHVELARRRGVDQLARRSVDHRQMFEGGRAHRRVLPSMRLSLVRRCYAAAVGLRVTLRRLSRYWPTCVSSGSTLPSKKWLAPVTTFCSMTMPFCVFSFSTRVFTSLAGTTASLSPWMIRPDDGQGARNEKS